MLSNRTLPAVALALTVALAACADGTGLSDDPFDPDASAQDLLAVQSAFAASVFESLSVSSENFQLVPDTGAAPAALLQASFGVASGHWDAAATAQAFAAGPAAGPLVPTDFRGRTYDRDADGYRHNANRTDAPVNGVRFILYEVDPVTRDIGSSEIGYVDLLDESTDLAYVARVRVVTSGVVRIDYTVSAVVGVQALTLTVSGFIGDGTDLVDVDLSMSFVEDAPVSVVTVDHVIAVPTRDFVVDATVVFTHNDETQQGSIDVDASFMQAHHSVTVVGVITFSEGDFPSEGGSFAISVDGQLFATVTVDGDNVTVQNSTGGELASAEAQAVRAIFDGLEDLFDEKFEDFVRPVRWMFDDAREPGAA